MMPYSILMSVYHKESPENLQASIESMLAQTAPAEQFVIVKDGPLTPELEGVLAHYQASKPELFTFVTLETNSGLAIALDTGMQACRNELVARMDSDDISLPQRCQMQLERFAQKPELVLVGTFIDEFYQDPGQVVSSRVVPEEYEEIRRFARRRNPFNHPTVMYKKSHVLRCGGYGQLKRCQDFDLFSRMVNMDCPAENIPQSLLLFRSNEGNYKRRKSWSACKGYISVVKRNYQRGYCSAFDYVYMVLVQTAMYLLPLRMVKLVSDRFLRKKK